MVLSRLVLILLVPLLLAACETTPAPAWDALGAGAADAASPDTASADAPSFSDVAAADVLSEAAPALLSVPPPPPPALEAQSVRTAKLPTAALKLALEAAVQGLWYTSESDYPFQVFALPGGGTPHATAWNIRDKVAPIYVPRPDTLPLAQRKVESVSLTTLLKNYVTPQDWWGDAEKARAPAFQKFKKLLTSQLTYLHVYRVGPKTPWGLSPDIDVFIVGTTAAGDLIVVWTVAIET